MKSVKQVSLNSIVFSLDHDAHKILEKYLYALNKALKNNIDKDEILADIESGIVEKLFEKNKSGNRSYCKN